MFPQSARSVPKSALILKLLVVLFLSIAATTLALAQGRAPSPPRGGSAPVGASVRIGNSSASNLVVQVLSEDHSFLNTQALVRLRNAQDGFGDAWQTTGTGSEASFSSLMEGPYEVEVSALGYKTSVTQVNVFGSALKPFR